MIGLRAAAQRWTVRVAPLATLAVAAALAGAAAAGAGDGSPEEVVAAYREAYVARRYDAALELVHPEMLAEKRAYVLADLRTMSAGERAAFLRGAGVESVEAFAALPNGQAVAAWLRDTTLQVPGEDEARRELDRAEVTTLESRALPDGTHVVSLAFRAVTPRGVLEHRESLTLKRDGADWKIRLVEGR